MKKGIILVVVLVSLLGIFIWKDYEKPAEAEEADIQIWYPNGYELALKLDLNDVEILHQLEEELDIPLFFYCVNGDMDSQFYTVLSDWGRNDAIFYRFSQEQLRSSYKNGQILDYTEYLDQMPNLKKLFSQYPELYQKACVDDRCLRFPAIIWNSYNDKVLAVRMDWMKQAGVSAVTNLDDLKEMLITQKAMFDRGELFNQGEYFAGLSSYGGYASVLQTAFHTCSGLYWNPDRTRLIYGPQTEEYRQYLIYMKELYRNQALDAHLYDTDSVNFEKYFLSNQSSVILAPIEQEGKLKTYSDTNGDYISIEYLNPCLLQEGEAAIYDSSMRKMQVLDFGFVIRRDLEPEKLASLLRLLDYLYSPEGMERLNWGNRGEHYEEDGQGRKVYRRELLEEQEYYMVAMSRYIKQDLLCTDRNANRWMLTEEQQDCIDAFQYAEDYSFTEPDGYYTAEESGSVKELKPSLSTYVDELGMKFIYGEADPADDEQWADYLEALKQLGVEIYKDIQEKAYRRMSETVFCDEEGKE